MTVINSPEDFGREFEKLKRKKTIHSQIQTEHDSRIRTPHDIRPVKQNDYSLVIFSALFLAVVFIGCFAYYSQQFITKEYGAAPTSIVHQVVQERQTCLAINENPDCCSKYFTKKLKDLWGCE